MDIVADIFEDASGAVKSAIEAAFEAGKAQGRREMKAEMQAHIAGFFGSDAVVLAPPVALPDSGDNRGDNGNGRAAPGSVKPVLEKMLLDAAGGLTPIQIAEKTGFKYNSVRGTLWTLGKEGIAYSEAGRWFATKKDENQEADLDRRASLLDQDEAANNAAVEELLGRGGHPEHH